MPDSLALIDTHCHLQFPQFDSDRQAVVERALAAGLRAVVVVGCEPADWRSALALADTWPQLVWLALGLHPNAVSEQALPDAMAELAELCTHPAVVAIGETGLDTYRDRCPLELQIRSLAAHLELARQRDLAVVLHCREAHDALYAQLQAAAAWDLRLVMHCFTSQPEQARRFAERGCWLGCDGPVTYPKATEAHQIARVAPAERLVLETDCPYLAPQGRRGQRCEPADLLAIAQRAAQLRGESLAQVAAASTQAALALFGRSLP